MGSTPSTPVRDRSDDPWYTIENQILDLNPNAMDPTNNPNENSVEEQRGHTETSESLLSNSTENENESESSFVDEANSVETISGSSDELSKSDIEIVSSPETSLKLKNSEDDRQQRRQQSLDEFKEELRIKREMRTNAISELRNEISSLRKQLADEKEINKQLQQNQNKDNLCHICGSIYNSLEQNAQSNITTAIATNESSESSISLRSQLAELQFSLQNANAEILTLSSELAATRKQAKSLKEVIAASKEIIEIRETELTQLKAKFKDIENSLAERELHVMSENLRQEYDRQLANIRNLRALYEERARISAAEKENLNRQLETSRAEYTAEVEKNKNLEDHIASLDTDLKSTTTDLYATKEQLAYYKAENRDLRDEMTVVNQLFGQLLAGFNGNNNIDIDKLTLMLEENRDLLNDITSKENCREGAAQIPKLIFDLVSQADKTTENPTEDDVIDSESPSATSTVVVETSTAKLSSAQEIIHNLPKVWRVLTELLNHQQLKPVQLQENNKGEHCYKSVETPSGPQMVLSVSKTYIRLKDLIMEKKFLQKETKKLKNLNSHLESRLGEQEQRLGAVTIELNKTWNLVGRMQRQHRQLHTHEQVLRYQLQQKRRMLSELKEELEYCRRKWALAKEKNNESQSQWETLRLEFSQRKENDLNNSAESGYSDSPASEEDEDESSISIDTSRSSRLKKKMNIDNFLHPTDEKDRKTIRIHSVSPVRHAKVSMTRRNSDSHITQYATEVFQSTSDEVQPILHTVCAECGENCVKHSVHFDTEPQKTTDQVKVSEPVIHNAKHELTNAQKLVESKASTSKTKMCCEIRHKATNSKPSTSKQEESLEEMFLRLSGASEEPTSDCTSSECQENQNDCNVSNECQENEMNNIENVPSAPTQEERELKRIARIERLEGQCKQLLSQVTRASSRGDELKKRINDIHTRYTPDRETTPTENQIQSELQAEPQPSTSRMERTETPSKSDEQCLSPTEKEYLLRRDERLKRLESESQAHIEKVKSINRLATDVDNKLEFLHGRYGSEETEENATGENVSPEVSEPQPSSSSIVEASPKSDEECLSATEKEYLARRDERLKRLEAESQAYMSRMKAAAQRTTNNVDNKLVNLHEHQVSETKAMENSVNSSTESTEESSNQNGNNAPQPSTSSGIETTEDSSKLEEQCLSATEQEYLSRRDERLKRLEAESQAYINRMKSISQRATDANSQLENLHERFSSGTETTETMSTTDESHENPPNQEENNRTADGPDSNIQTADGPDSNNQGPSN